MIKLTKQSCPNKLSKNYTTWTAQLMKVLEDGQKPKESLVSHYRDPEIKQAIKEDSFDKCIYCESKISHVYHGDVEHIKPKSKYPSETFSWTNLGYVCAKCNGAKGDKYDEELPYVNPYEEDPNNFFFFLGEMIFARKDNDRGKLTELDIEINRPGLLENRRARIKTVRALIDESQKLSNEALRQAVLNEVQKEIETDKEYSMCTAQFAEHYNSS